MIAQIREFLKDAVEGLFGGMVSSDQIAQVCREKKIQGFMNDCASCPMIKLVNEKLGVQVQFVPHGKLGLFGIFMDDVCVKVPGKVVCTEFARKFDAGEYPDLCAIMQLKTQAS